MEQGITLGQAWAQTSAEIWRGRSDERNSYNRLDTACDILGKDKLLQEALAVTNLMKLVSVLRDERGLAPGTINRYLAALSKFCTVCVDLDLLDKPPKFKAVKQKEPPGRSRWFDDDEIPQFLQAMGSYQNSRVAKAAQALFILSLLTGARRSELLGVDPKKDVSHLRDTWRVTFRVTKNGKPRSIDIDDEAARLLHTYAPWGPKETGSTSFAWRFYDVWKHAKKVMGLENDEELVLHASRHTFATQLVDDNVNIRVIQELLGHLHVTTTQRYAHASSAARSDALAGVRRRIGSAIKGGPNGHED